MFHSRRATKSPVHRIENLQSMVISKPEDPRLKSSIRVRNFKHDRVEIDGVSITFARQGVFVAKGAGPGTRQPKDWINPVLDKEVPELADKLGELGADLALKETAKLIGNGKD